MPGPQDDAPRRRWWLQAIVVFVAYQGFEIVRSWASGSESVARRNGHHLLRLERTFHVDIERGLQAALSSHLRLMQVANVFYGTVHFVGPVVGLVLLYRRAPGRYARFRNAIVCCNLVGLACFFWIPLMPPRLLPTAPGTAATAPANCDLHQVPFIDTNRCDGGMGVLDQSPTDVENLYAAMPSLHAAWSLWTGLAVFPLVRRRWQKALALADPIVTVIVVMVTGNHWFLDAVAGWVCLAAGFGLATLLAPVVEKRRTKQLATA